MRDKWNANGEGRDIIAVSELAEINECMASFRDETGFLFIESLNCKELEEEYEILIDFAQQIKVTIDVMRENLESEIQYSKEKETLPLPIELISGRELPDWSNEDLWELLRKRQTPGETLSPLQEHPREFPDWNDLRQIIKRGKQ